MKMLINDLYGETVTVDLTNADEFRACYAQDDVLYIDGVPCVLSTARSLEAEALKEAKSLLWELRSYVLRQRPMPEDLRDRLSLALDGDEKWGRE